MEPSPKAPSPHDKAHSSKLNAKQSSHYFSHTEQLSTIFKKFITSMFPCTAAVCYIVVLDASTVMANSGCVCIKTFNTPATRVYLYASINETSGLTLKMLQSISIPQIERIPLFQVHYHLHFYD
ncbi:hypothetical protein Hanom_Chr11g01028051 [Helianthus anomalus]